MSTILITGGAGYIGSHTAVCLAQAGHSIVILDNLSNAGRDAIRRIELLTERSIPFHEVDLCEKEAVRAVFQAHSIDAVIHFAGLKAVGESVAQPLRYYRTNLTATLNLCEVMDEFDCRTLVFSSSASVYGLNNQIPYSEDMPLGATNPYGCTKLMQEQILRDLHAADPRWRILLLRYFNPIGAHESGLLTENPKGIPNNLLPYVVRVAAGQLDCLHIFGDDYDTADGTGVRDYIHVMDLAEGHSLALNYLETHEGIDAINLGTGHGYSVLEIVRSMETACGHEIPYVMDPRRPGDIAACWADTRKAKELLGWQASRSLEQMCRDSWNAIQKQ